MWDPNDPNNRLLTAESLCSLFFILHPPLLFLDVAPLNLQLLVLKMSAPHQPLWDFCHAEKVINGL